MTWSQIFITSLLFMSAGVIVSINVIERLGTLGWESKDLVGLSQRLWDVQFIILPMLLAIAAIFAFLGKPALRNCAIFACAFVVGTVLGRLGFVVWAFFAIFSGGA